ncbi:MAG: PD-(D/E)XK nuclease family protein, partial [Primorskyibacter sp.]
WPAIRPLWQARVDRMAARFVMGEARRQRLATPTAFERRGMLRLPELGFELVGKLDRIDLSPDGTARVYDYKTGAPPTAAVQKAFDKQLLLEAAMIEAGGIEGMGPMPVVEATYLGLGPEAPEVPAPIETVSAQQTCADLALLIGAYRDAAQGYPSRNASFSARDVGDYDHLARYGEWDESHPSVKTVLT